MELIEGKLYKVTEKVAPQFFFVAPYLRGKLNGELPKEWEKWGNVITGPVLIVPETQEE